MNNTDKYLEMTGQELGELMQGALQYGPSFIEDELVLQALTEKKKIIWIPRLVEGEDIGLVDYELQPV